MGPESSSTLNPQLPNPPKTQTPPSFGLGSGAAEGGHCRRGGGQCMLTPDPSDPISWVLVHELNVNFLSSKNSHQNSAVEYAMYIRICIGVIIRLDTRIRAPTQSSWMHLRTHETKPLSGLCIGLFTHQSSGIPRKARIGLSMSCRCPVQFHASIVQFNFTRACCTAYSYPRHGARFMTLHRLTTCFQVREEPPGFPSVWKLPGQDLHNKMCRMAGH